MLTNNLNLYTMKKIEKILLSIVFINFLLLVSCQKENLEKKENLENITSEDRETSENQWKGSNDSYVVEGKVIHGSEIKVTNLEKRFGIKPGGGPPILWDFGKDVFVNGVKDNFNEQLSHLQNITETPLYGSVSSRRPVKVYSDGSDLRHNFSKGHYFSDSSEEGSSGKAGTYFHGVAATGGKTSRPATFKDDRYYFSMRVKYPDGIDDNSLKTLRGSQRDSQQEGWSGSKAVNIKKFQMGFKQNGERVWPREYTPVWTATPFGWRDGIRDWHLEELFIDPTGTIEPGRVWTHSTFYFKNSGRSELYIAVRPSEGSGHMPVEYWENDRGFYHQVGPEPAGYKQPDYHFGEVYIDDSFRRVYLADAPTWDNVQKVELQRIKLWNESTIEFVLNLGSFNLDQKLYLYWIDNNNNAYLFAEQTILGKE